MKIQRMYRNMDEDGILVQMGMGYHYFDADSYILGSKKPKNI